MRSRMVVHDADATLFEATLKKAVEARILRGPLTAIIDSSPVHGAGALCDTYELIRGFYEDRAVMRNATPSGAVGAAPRRKRPRIDSA